MAHVTLFEEKSLVYKMMKPVAIWADDSPAAKGFMTFSEHMAKTVLFHCLNCGDCGLFDVGFVCPTSQCPKGQRNGACGGSYQGWCEVYPGKQKCVWVQAYDRLKNYGQEDSLGAYIVPPCDWELWQTSSWLNFYMGRDHTAKRLGIKPPVKKTPEKP